MCTANRILFSVLFILGYRGHSASMVSSNILFCLLWEDEAFLFVSAFWGLLAYFCMALITKRTGETADDMSSTEHARYLSIYHVRKTSRLVSDENRGQKALCICLHYSLEWNSIELQSSHLISIISPSRLVGYHTGKR